MCDIVGTVRCRVSGDSPSRIRGSNPGATLTPEISIYDSRLDALCDISYVIIFHPGSGRKTDANLEEGFLVYKLESVPLVQHIFGLERYVWAILDLEDG